MPRLHPFIPVLIAALLTGLITANTAAEVEGIQREQSASANAFSAIFFEDNDLTDDSDIGFGDRTTSAGASTSSAFDGGLITANASTTASFNTLGNTLLGFNGSGSASVTAGTSGADGFSSASAGLSFTFQPVDIPAVFDFTFFGNGTPAGDNGSGNTFFRLSSFDGSNSADLFDSNDGDSFSIQLELGTTYSFFVNGGADARQAASTSASWNFSGTFTDIESGPIRWSNASGGVFDTAENWAPQNVPTASDDILFDLTGAYSVGLTQAQSVNNATVDAGDVTLNLNGHALTIGEKLVVGSDPSTPATLRIPDLANLNVNEIIVGEVDYQNATLILGPDAAEGFAATIEERKTRGGGTAGLTSDSTDLTVRVGSKVMINSGRTEFRKFLVTADEGSITNPIPYPTPVVLDGRQDPDAELVAETIEVGSLPASSQGDEAGQNVGIASNKFDAKADFVLFSSDVRFEQDSRLTALKSLVLGHNENSPNTTTIKSGSRVLLPSSALLIEVGDVSDSTIDFDNGFLEAAGTPITIGDSSKGTMNLRNQSQADAANMVLGNNAEALGIVDVSSETGTSTLNASQIDVAIAGAGLLRVMDGGDVNVTGDVNVSSPQSDPPASFNSFTSLTDPSEFGTGMVIVNGTGTLFADTINVGMNGVLMGTGTVEGTSGINISGALKPGASPGALNLIGNLNVDAGGMIEIEVAGLTPAVAYDQLFVDGNTVINGKVVFSFMEGFAPVIGDSFEFLNATGDIDLSSTSFDVTGLADGFEFEIAASATGFRMVALTDGVATTQAIPAPAALPAGITLLLLMSARRRAG